MDKILIDTDVVLDFFFDRKPFSDNASKIFSLCETGKAKGYITPVICSNIYYILRQTAAHDKVIEKLSMLLTFIDVLSIDKDIVKKALSSGFRDFEDALQNFSAEKAGFINVLLTRNVKDYSKSEISVMMPGDYLKTKRT